MKTNLLKQISMLLVGSVLVVSMLTACSNSKPNKKEETTTKKIVVKETTTVQETTTEEETTKFNLEKALYNVKGVGIAVSSKEKCQKMMNYTISKGDIIALNDFCDDSANDVERGVRLYSLYEALNMDMSYLIETFGNGTEIFIISKDENYTFEYTGDEEYIFDYIGEDYYVSDNIGRTRYWFDIHVIK